MAATLSTIELNGAPPGATSEILDGGNLTYQMSDSHTEDADNPILRPLSGSYYSYWKSVYLNAKTTPPTQINNVKIYGPGSYGWTGVTLYIGDETPAIGSYEQAIGTLGKTGDEIVASHGGITTKTTMNTYTSGSPKSVSGSISNPNTGAITPLLITQLQITTDAISGGAGTAVMTWRYDEA